MRRAVILLCAVALTAFAVRAGALSWFGTLPGDIVAEREGARVNVPFTSLVVLAVALSIAVQLLFRLLTRRHE